METPTHTAPPVDLDRLVSLLPFAYKRGNNPAGDAAYYHCGHCGIELHAEQVGFVAAGCNYANGEHSRCPRCGKENAVFRDSLD
jgi:hypothetical protein